MSQKFAEDYVDVAERLQIFRDRHPEGSLQAADMAEPVKIITIADKTFLQYVALAFRSPDDPRPGVGVAWEPFPGRTPYTRDSEAMVAETSAWGRAIVAVLAADTKRGVASADEIRSRQADRQAPPIRQLQAEVWNRSKEHDPALTDDERRQYIAGELAALGGDRDNPDTLTRLLKEWEK